MLHAAQRLPRLYAEGVKRCFTTVKLRVTSAEVASQDRCKRRTGAGSCW